MNNYDKPLLKLDGLEINDLYLEDVSKVYEHSDRHGNRYLTLFMINNVQVNVPSTPNNIKLLLFGGHRIYEYSVINSLLVQEESPTSFDFHQQSDV